jgi:hypothetical protein
LDGQVLAFIKLIAPHLNGINIDFLMEMKDLDEQQCGFINQMLEIFREEKSPNALICVQTSMGNIQFLPDMDNKTLAIDLDIDAATDIPLLIEWLATLRPDGQQRVIWINGNDQLAMEMVDAIKQVENFIFQSLYVILQLINL